MVLEITQGVSFTDSVKNRSIQKPTHWGNLQFKDMAQRDQTSTGCFFGLTLHLIINDKAEIISSQLTRGNVADNTGTC